MSVWQSYVDDQLIGSGKVRGAAIIAAADGTVWAQSPDLAIRAGEGAAIVALYKKPDDVFATGVTAGGIKYMGTKADDRSIYGRKAPPALSWREPPARSSSAPTPSHNSRAMP